MASEEQFQTTWVLKKEGLWVGSRGWCGQRCAESMLVVTWGEVGSHSLKLGNTEGMAGAGLGQRVRVGLDHLSCGI